MILVDITNGKYVGTGSPVEGQTIAIQDGPPNGDNWYYDLLTKEWKYVVAIDADGRYLGNLPIDDPSIVGLADEKIPSVPGNDVQYLKWDDTLKEWDLVFPDYVTKMRDLQESDALLARGIEDLFDFLLAKGIVTELEIPSRLLDIITYRKQLRSELL